MRQKTDYAEIPQTVEIRRSGIYALVTFTENVVEIVEDERTHWQADAYTIRMLDAAALEQRIGENVALWLAYAKQADRDAEAERVRAMRNELIAATDMYMRDDYPASVEFKQQIAAYSQALRDIPEQAGFPYTIEWPAKPQAPSKTSQELTRVKVDNLVVAFDAFIGGETE